MNCIFLSRGKPTPMTKTVTLTGSFSGSYGYVTINGTKYTSAQTLEIEDGTEISVYVSGSSSQREYCNITLDGETVLTGAGTYTFVLSSPVTIEMTLNQVVFYYYCTAAITTG